jgi:hypothetical protein
VNVILQNRVKQAGVHRNASHCEHNIPNVPFVPEVPLYECPKISDSPNRKQKELFQISWNKDKENKPAKVAQSTLVLLVKSEDIMDSDEDLETMLVLLTPRKPFRNSLSRSNKPVMKQLKGYSVKQQYDQILALNMRKERQDIPGIKREPHVDAGSSGC